MNDDVIEAEIVRAEAEASAPFAVTRMFGELTDFELKVFALRCAGVGVSHIAERLECSPSKVRSAMKARTIVFAWLDEFIPESERDRVDQERERLRDAQFERYCNLWDRVMEQAEAKLEEGDLDVIKMLMKDLSVRMFGATAKEVKHKHDHRASGEVKLRAVPASISGNVNKLLDGE
jgi:hypothetical protein